MQESIEALKNHADNSKALDPSELDQQLDNLISELSKSVAHRVQASKSNIQQDLLKIIEMEMESGHTKDSVTYLIMLREHFF
jgi:regulator of sirC expression with transglutaminase-like and TPR domain